MVTLKQTCESETQILKLTVTPCVTFAVYFPSSASISTFA